jgi:hypothetical protein
MRRGEHLRAQPLRVKKRKKEKSGVKKRKTSTGTFAFFIPAANKQTGTWGIART